MGWNWYITLNSRQETTAVPSGMQGESYIIPISVPLITIMRETCFQHTGSDRSSEKNRQDRRGSVWMWLWGCSAPGNPVGHRGWVRVPYLMVAGWWNKFKRSAVQHTMQGYGGCAWDLSVTRRGTLYSAERSRTGAGTGVRQFLYSTHKRCSILRRYVIWNKGLSWL